MTLHPIGPASAALYLTGAELSQRGLSGAGLTLEQALELSRAALAQADFPLDGPIEIEAYPDSCGVLVFIHIQLPRQLWFSFGSLEHLLDGARALSSPPEQTALLWWAGRWWLSLPTDARRHANRLSEFGRSETGRPHLEARLAEYATPILPRAAVAALCAHFPAGGGRQSGAQ